MYPASIKQLVITLWKRLNTLEFVKENALRKESFVIMQMEHVKLSNHAL